MSDPRNRRRSAPLSDDCISRVYVRLYTDSGQRVFYVDWHSGARTECHFQRWAMPHYSTLYSPGGHAHALLHRANQLGLRLEREIW